MWQLRPVRISEPCGSAPSTQLPCPRAGTLALPSAPLNVTRAEREGRGGEADCRARSSQ